MSANGDQEMTDAVAGSEVEAVEDFTEPQRIRVVSILSFPPTCGQIQKDEISLSLILYHHTKTY